MAKVQQSRFALLQVDDDDSDDAVSKSNQGKKGGQQNQKNVQKKKNKKKKQQNQAENEELKHLAFGVPSRHHTHSVSSDQGRPNGSHEGSSQQQWNEWQRMDEEYAADAFERDLQQALLLSRLENEHDKQTKPQVNTDQGAGGDSKASKKKKKKDKPQTMSLDQFNKQEEEKKTVADELDVVRPPSPTTKIPTTECDQKFFKKVDDDVSRIIRQEKMQEEYKKQYAAESVITAKYQEKISKMEKEIEFLRATMKKQDEELKQVKKRNKQLCVILAQGEMKDKSEVLQQVNQLTEVKDELTEQVSSLTADLEKERSKVHSLKAELDKYKNGKHK